MYMYNYYDRINTDTINKTACDPGCSNHVRPTRWQDSLPINNNETKA